MKLLQRWRLQRLHKKLLPPSKLTFGRMQEVSAMLGLDADALLTGEQPPVAPTLAQGQAFLDLAYPGHGLDLKRLRMEDVDTVLAVATANFMVACRVNGAVRTLSSGRTRSATGLTHFVRKAQRGRLFVA